MDSGFRKPFSNTNRWFLTIVNQEEFKKVAGEVKLCDKMEVAPEAPVAEEPKKEQPKKEQPKKEEQKKEKPKKKKEEEEEEDDDPEKAEREAEKKKGPNPLDLLPPR